MAVDSTRLLREVDNIIQQGQGLSHYQLRCQILAGNRWLTPAKINLQMIERDYETGFGDVIVLDLMVGWGDYAYDLIPNRDTLMVEMITIALYENSTAERGNVPRSSRRYRAVLMEQENPGLTGKNPQTSSQEDLNRMQLKPVQLQLMDEGLYQVRMQSVGRIYRKQTPMQALTAMLTETTRLLATNRQQTIFGVNTVKGYNETVRDHIVIPHGTPLTEVPNLLQTSEGGIYATGLGCFLQQGFWYVYPLYNTQRFSQTPKTLTVLNVPSNRYMAGERTYRTTANQVVIVSAGDMSSLDEGLYQQLNEGNAARFADARQILTTATQPSNNRVSMSRQDNVFEVEGAALKGGMTNAKWSKVRATSNPFTHYSEMARRAGRVIQIQWEHGDTQLLTPGMPVKFLTAAGNKLTTRFGVLLGTNEQRVPSEGGAVASRYPATVNLAIFLTREDNGV